MYKTQTEIAVTPPSIEDERRQLEAWNNTRQDHPSNTCTPQLVARQAMGAPDAVAVVAGEDVLTYGELNLRANRLAHYLQTLGVGRNDLVGICVGRSLDMVIGLLGILKAGAAYVPLDPSYPAERLAFMLEDARVPVLVTWQSLAARLPAGDAQVVCLDRDEVLLEQPGDEPFSIASPADRAYVIYTSGSTGQPKGVEISHSSLLNLIYWHQHAFEVTSADRATQTTSPAFDATGWELWPYLTRGAQVYIVDEQTRVSPASLRDWLVEHGITISFLTTALAESVISLAWPAQTPLRYLLTGADALRRYPSPDLPFALVNNYGPTESTVVATYGRVLPTTRADVPPSIGRPIWNTQIFILDERLRQVPIGAPGELYIGGSGLALGYLNRPGLTNERFIPHPLSDTPGERLYKTGDLARFLPDGQIAFMGRADQQIKIRGYRIEPDEITAVLLRHPAVQSSLVVAREDTSGDKRLVAYLVPASAEAALTVAALRATLCAYLPDYMIPAVFVIVGALPVTSNGKVDRNALPPPDATNTLRDEVVAPPQTPSEAWVAHIVTELLGLDAVGVDDNFFMLGGHSLLGTQIIARVNGAFGIGLPLRSLFEAPTVRLLAAEIERRAGAKLAAMSRDGVLGQLNGPAAAGPVR